METILEAQPQIDVVWAANDEMAVGALKAIKEAGKSGRKKSCWLGRTASRMHVPPSQLGPWPRPTHCRLSSKATW